MTNQEELFLFYELVDCVVELVYHFLIALFDCVDYTMLKMILQNNLACVVDSRLNGGKLNENVAAILVVFDHLLNLLKMTDSTGKTV